MSGSNGQKDKWLVPLVSGLSIIVVGLLGWGGNTIVREVTENSQQITTNTADIVELKRARDRILDRIIGQINTGQQPVAQPEPQDQSQPHNIWPQTP